VVAHPCSDPPRTAGPGPVPDPFRLFRSVPYFRQFRCGHTDTRNMRVLAVLACHLLENFLRLAAAEPPPYRPLSRDGLARKEISAEKQPSTREGLPKMLARIVSPLRFPFSLYTLT